MTKKMSKKITTTKKRKKGEEIKKGVGEAVGGAHKIKKIKNINISVVFSRKI